jgi:hypothetical protein
MFSTDAISPASSTPVAPPPAITILPFRFTSDILWAIFSASCIVLNRNAYSLNPAILGKKGWLPKDMTRKSYLNSEDFPSPYVMKTVLLFRSILLIVAWIKSIFLSRTISL